ncbi:hypothetical protein [Stenotrophomonas indicatrix]|uniref:hypothetical protein n=1 Tax=Stenotrophomonas indicatrix TaxID=2045451 RepID=UPI0028ABAF17|nr:hypothetical protein [Stenotrophomonas indicatrix]
MANAWFRMYAEFASDAKVQMMSEAMQRRLLMVFCMRCSDVTVTLSDDEIAFQMRITTEELAETKALFLRKGFIDQSWNVLNWEKRQFASDSSAARTRAYRDRQRDKTVTSQVTKGDALEQNRTDTEQNRTEVPTDVGLSTAGGDAATDDHADDDAEEGQDLLGNRPKKPAVPNCPHMEIIDLYHEVLPELAQVRVWEEDRKELLRARWKGAPERQSLDWWREFFASVREMPFLMGERTDRDGRAFACTLEWLVRPKNFAKVIEGNYLELRR